MDKKRILVTLACSKCGRNLEFDGLIDVRPSNGAAYCHQTCDTYKDGKQR